MPVVRAQEAQEVAAELEQQGLTGNESDLDVEATANLEWVALEKVSKSYVDAQQLVTAAKGEGGGDESAFVEKMRAVAHAKKRFALTSDIQEELWSDDTKAQRLLWRRVHELQVTTILPFFASIDRASYVIHVQSACVFVISDNSSDETTD